MLTLPETLKTAIAHFTRLPGVGEKTATRQVLLLSSWRPDELAAFGAAIASLSRVQRCEECGLFSEGPRCSLCQSDERRQNQTVCVVEYVTDAMAIERSGHFQGLFHVLGGVLNPLAGIGPDELDLDRLFRRIDENDIVEVIMAVNPSVEGDATCAYIKQHIQNAKVRVQRIGLGIPVGGSLEYVDAQTISKALENRKLF